MPAHTATVEVLTAEVRVLMVGSRQITLSVARQLDEVDWGQIEPMGRIRDGDTVGAIGRDVATGNLVKAYLGWRPWFLDRRELEEEERRATMRRADGSLYDSPPGCEDNITRLRALRDFIDNEEYPRWAARKKALEALPLIVLAGLR